VCIIIGLLLAISTNHTGRSARSLTATIYNKIAIISLFTNNLQRILNGYRKITTLGVMGKIFKIIKHWIPVGFTVATILASYRYELRTR